MSGWLLHHFIAVAALVIVGTALVLTYALRRAWVLVIPLPALLATLAWRGWEYSDEAAAFALGIALLGYLGLGLGAGLRQVTKRL